MIRTLYKIVGVLLLCGMLIFLVGCWDRREVNDIAIIVSTGIDYSDEKEIELSVEMIMPEEMAGKISQGGGAGGRTTFVESATGVTLADARSKLQEKVARYLFWGHAEATVIGEKLAEQGIQEHMDFFARMPEARLRSKVFVSKGDAKKLISSLPHLEDSGSEALKELSEFQIGMNVTMNELMQMLESETGGAAIPMIESISSKEGDGKLPDKTQLKLSGTAVFKQDKMIGSLDSEVTRGLLWIRDEIRYATVTVDVEEGEGKISMEMIRAKTEKKPSIKDNKWQLQLKVNTDDDVIQNASTLDLRNPQFIKMLEQEAAKAIEERIQLAIEQVQKKMKVDIFKFNESFRFAYPNEWQTARKNWEKIFPEVEINVVVEPHVLRPGLSTTPPAVRSSEVKEE
ncbi:Ger(x)C family spore germination protein [Anaerobacillus sp. MEB173]|uniref:Ger(x)C family spore germination protein n=1 Tax=Anaerobacillus sp. MEB173 TaxID=3383345 RepID=UPI003F91A53A